MPTQWATGANDPCTVTGAVCCLRNDLPRSAVHSPIGFFDAD
jgi:hypothetical protein